MKMYGFIKESWQEHSGFSMLGAHGVAERIQQQRDRNASLCDLAVGVERRLNADKKAGQAFFGLRAVCRWSAMPATILRLISG